MVHNPSSTLKPAALIFRLSYHTSALYFISVCFYLCPPVIAPLSGWRIFFYSAYTSNLNPRALTCNPNSSARIFRTLLIKAGLSTNRRLMYSTLTQIYLPHGGRGLNPAFLISSVP